jgi:hypothetical protein
MSLIAALKIPMPKRLRDAAAAASAAARNASVDKQPAGSAASVPATNEAARTAAAALRPRIAAQRQQAAEVWSQLDDQRTRLTKQIDALGKLGLDERRAELEKRLVDVSGKLEAAGKIIGRLDADLQAVDDPGSRADVLLAVAARHRSGASVAPTLQKSGAGAASVDLQDDKLVVSRTDGVAVQAALEGGVATGESRVDTSRFELGQQGDVKFTSASTEVKHRQAGETSVTNTGLKSFSVGTDGIASKESNRKELVGADGKPRSVEKSEEVKLGASGFEVKKSDAVKRADGSGTANQSTGGAERGDGKLYATAGKSVTRTDAHGTEEESAGKLKGGLIAGEDGTGVGGAFDGKLGKKRENGIASTADLKLVAGLVCDIVEIESQGDERRYQFKLQLDLGIDVGVATGHDKDGASAKAGVNAKAGKAVFLRVTKELDEKAAAAYRKGLEAASTGAKVGLGDEFEVIRAFAKTGAAGARQVYAQLFGDGADAATLDTLKAGETRQSGGTETLGGGVSANVKAVGVKLGAEQQKAQSTLLAKGADGSLLMKQDESQSLTLSGEASVSYGLVEGSIGASATRTTSKGLKIEIPHGHALAREMEQRLKKCKTQADLDRFAADFPAAIERSRGEGEASTESVGIGVAGVKLGLNLKQGIAESEVRDGQGQLRSRKVVGSAGRGGSLGPLGDSVDEKIAAEKTADGKVRADLTRAAEAQSIGKQIDAKAEELKKLFAPKTAADLTGGNKPADTKVRNVQGITLKTSDLARLGQIALGRPREWMRGCTSAKALADWEAACDAVRDADGDPAVVAEELARFIGKDKGDRLAMVNRFIRPDGKVSTGQRTEFPEGLASLQAVYEAAVLSDPHEGLQELVDAGAAAQARAQGDKLIAQLQELDGRVGAAKNFSRPAVRGEMLSAIAGSRSKILAVLRQLDDTPAKPAAAHDSPEFKEYMSFVKVCVDHEMTQVSFIEKLREMEESYHSFKEKQPILSQWRDLLALWQRDYERMAGLARLVGKAPAIYERYGPSRKHLDEWENRLLINR